MQEFINGDEFVVDLVKSEEQFFIASLCKYTKIGAMGLIYHALDIIDPSDTAYSKLVEYTINCANALSLVKGPMHMEFMRDQQGFVMIEAGARLHGGIAPEFFKSCYVPHLLQVAVDSFVSKPFERIQASKKCEGRIVFLHTQTAYTMPKLDTSELMELQHLPSYQGHKFFIQSGQQVPKTVSLLDCPGIVWLAHEDINVINQDYVKVRELLDFNDNVSCAGAINGKLSIFL